MIKTLMLVALLSVDLASAADSPPDSAMITHENITKIYEIDLDSKAYGFVFINKYGFSIAVKAETCKDSDICMELLKEAPVINHLLVKSNQST